MDPRRAGKNLDALEEVLDPTSAETSTKRSATRRYSFEPSEFDGIELTDLAEEIFASINTPREFAESAVENPNAWCNLLKHLLDSSRSATHNANILSRQNEELNKIIAESRSQVVVLNDLIEYTTTRLSQETMTSWRLRDLRDEFCVSNAILAEENKRLRSLKENQVNQDDLVDCNDERQRQRIESTPRNPHNAGHGDGARGSHREKTSLAIPAEGDATPQVGILTTAHTTEGAIETRHDTGRVSRRISLQPKQKSPRRLPSEGEAGGRSNMGAKRDEGAVGASTKIGSNAAKVAPGPLKVKPQRGTKHVRWKDVGGDSGVGVSEKVSREEEGHGKEAMTRCRQTATPWGRYFQAGGITILLALLQYAAAVHFGFL